MNCPPRCRACARRSQRGCGRIHAGETARRWLISEIGIAEPAAEQLLEYLAASFAALECLPTQDTLVFERFFDEAGGMQLVIHSPFGSRINRAWGLALRKRFCRKFNFELQAAATEDNIVLSLTTTHSFELAEVARYLHSDERPIAADPGPARCADVRHPLALGGRRGARAAAVPRRQEGARRNSRAWKPRTWSPRCFPTSSPARENVAGDREIPDHPLTNQTIADCLHEAMDIEGLERLLARLEAGDIRVVARDLTQPSPLALEVLSARPYAYLDDAPLEERRTQAVMARRWLAPESATELGRLDAEAIARVRTEAWPDPVNAEELHDALLWLGCLSAEEAQAVPEWSGWLTELARDNRVTRLQTPQATLWVAAERLRQFQALWPAARAVARHRATGGAGAARVVSGRSPDRDPAWPARGSGTGDARSHWQRRSDWSRTRSMPR